MTSPTGTLAAWRRRFLAPAVSFPSWARDEPDRLIYSSNESGKWEVCAWDRKSDARRQLTDRPEGTSGAQIDPAGMAVWWLDDHLGDERGRWVTQPFEGGTAVTVPDLPEGYSSGLLLGRALTVVGTTDENGTVLRLLNGQAPPAELYRHEQQAWAAALARDETLIAIEHSEHGDTRNPAVRILDLRGGAQAEIDDGPGHSVEAIAWSPVPGDQRLLLSHEREGLARPLIWQHDRQQRQEVQVDLPGEVGASWYPDGAALLIGHRYRGRSELYRLELGNAQLTRLEVPAGTSRRRASGPTASCGSSGRMPPLRPRCARRRAPCCVLPENRRRRASLTATCTPATSTRSWRNHPASGRTRPCSMSTEGRSRWSTTPSPRRSRPSSTTASPSWR